MKYEEGLSDVQIENNTQYILFSFAQQLEGGGVNYVLTFQVSKTFTPTIKQQHPEYQSLFKISIFKAV